MITDEVADYGQINMSEPLSMDVDESVIEIKSSLQKIPCQDEPMAFDLEEEVQNEIQLNSSTIKTYHLAC